MKRIVCLRSSTRQKRRKKKKNNDVWIQHTLALASTTWVAYMWRWVENIDRLFQVSLSLSLSRPGPCLTSSLDGVCLTFFLITRPVSAQNYVNSYVCVCAQNRLQNYTQWSWLTRSFACSLVIYTILCWGGRAARSWTKTMERATHTYSRTMRIF